MAVERKMARRSSECKINEEQTKDEGKKCDKAGCEEREVDKDTKRMWGESRESQEEARMARRGKGKRKREREG